MLLIFFEVEPEKAGDILTALAPHMPSLKDFRVETAKTEPVKNKITRAPAGQGEHRSYKNSRVIGEIVKQFTPNQKTYTKNALIDCLVAAGFKSTSLSPALTYLKRDSKIKVEDQFVTWIGEFK